MKTLTFLFTDVEGSTRLWEAHEQAMRPASARHDQIVRAAIEGHEGEVVKTTGDGFHAAFANAGEALRATVEAQRALAAEAWSVPGGIRARMALHTGEAEPRDGDYYGATLNRAARLMSIGHGGQTLLSAATAELVRDRLPPDCRLRDLGVRRLRDLERPERVFQLEAEGMPTEFPALRSLESVPHNLPVQLTSFIGRAHELSDLRRSLGNGRLLTLTGAGGAGKTRLAIQIGAEAIDDYTDGVFFVDLAGLTDPSLVPQSVAETVGVREAASRPIAETLVRSLRDKRMLLILDNCEHLVGACARLADDLVRGCPALSLLATSREPLGIAGETLYRVPSLGLPDEGAAGPLEAAESVRLFAERAAAVAPGFRLTRENAPAVAEICRRLDGIPLAIELAAARARVLSPAEIAARLEDRFRLLTGGSRTALPRQKTLHALISWSHDLLAPAERMLYRRLCVFSGGFTLEACESVCAVATPAGDLPSADVLDLLEQLVARSLVLAKDGATTRYHVLETIRAYGRERLVEAGEEGALRDRHLAFCLALCRGAEPELIGADQRAWFDRIALEHENLRAAMAWGLEQAPRQTLEIAKVLFWFWQSRGHTTEGRTWLDAALGRPEAREGDALRQGALVGAGSLAWMAGDHGSARTQLAEAVEVARRLGDRRALAIALTLLGHSMVFADDLTEARPILEESVTIAREGGDPFALARALGSLADAARHAGSDDALRYADEAIAAFGRIGMAEGIGFNLAYGAWPLMRRDPAQARARLLQALALFEKIDHPYGSYTALMGLLELASPAQEVAARLLGAMEAFQERSSVKESAFEARIVERLRTAATRTLGEAGLATAIAEGRALVPAEAIALAKTLEPRRP